MINTLKGVPNYVSKDIEDLDNPVACLRNKCQHGILDATEQKKTIVNNE